MLSQEQLRLYSLVEKVFFIYDQSQSLSIRAFLFHLQVCTYVLSEIRIICLLYCSSFIQIILKPNSYGSHKINTMGDLGFYFHEFI